ncbi:MAG: braE1 [Frankiales bacterium]|nr:braE1 [Frankiales bacterium]
MIKLPNISPRSIWPAIIAILALLVIGWFLLGAMSDATAAIAVLALYYAVAGLSFSFLQGTLGLFSLAQPVFLLVGGYTDAYFYAKHGISPWICIFIAMGISVLLAIPIALACVRSTGSAILVALVTLIIAQAVAPIVVSIKALGGALGILIDVKATPHWTDMEFLTPGSFAKLLLVVNVILIALLTWFKRSKFGYWAAAARDVPVAANAAGVPVRRLSITLFVISSAVVAPAGVIYAQYNLNVTTDLFLSTTALFQVSVVALAGGAGRAWGALSGAVIVVYLTQKAGDIANGHPGLPNLTFAVLFLIMALSLPRGLSGTWAMFADRRRRRLAGPLGSIELVNAEVLTPAEASKAAEESTLY